MLTKKYVSRAWTPLLAAAAVAAMSGTASANKPYNAVSTFYSAGLATSKCQASDIFSEGTSTWRSAIKAHSITLGPNDGTIFHSEVTDAAFGGQDDINNNLDTGEISFIATHGATNRNGCTSDSYDCSNVSWYAQMSSTSQDPEGDCFFETPEMYLGNSGGHHVNYLDAFACNSLELTWTNDYQSGVAFGLHQWHGFAGTMGVGSGTATHLDDYVNAAFSGSAAEAWVTWETDYHHWSAKGADVCATARTWGNSTADATSREANETYKSGSYSDPGWTYSVYTYMSDCDPPSSIPGKLGTWTLGYHP